MSVSRNVGVLTGVNGLCAENNIKRAIAACKEENGNVLQNRQQMSMVKEAEDEGYCDISGRVDDLMFLGKSFYVS